MEFSVCAYIKSHILLSPYIEITSYFLQFSEIIPILIVSKTSGKSSQTVENTDADVSCEEYILF